MTHMNADRALLYVKRKRKYDIPIPSSQAGSRPASMALVSAAANDTSSLDEE